MHVLLYSLPGVPSVYYGSEWGIEGEKRRGGPDDAIRPALRLEEMQDNACSRLVAALGQIRREHCVLAYGDYRELLLRNCLEIVRSCPCEKGCPSCVGPETEIGPAGKRMAEELLGRLLET